MDFIDFYCPSCDINFLAGEYEIERTSITSSETAINNKYRYIIEVECPVCGQDIIKETKYIKY